jgi:hypothetical protein
LVLAVDNLQAQVDGTGAGFRAEATVKGENRQGEKTPSSEAGEHRSVQTIE